MQEILEKKLVRTLILFTRRCIDVIELLRIVSFHGDQSLFQRMLVAIDRRAKKKKLDPLLEELSSTCFRDLVLEGGNLVVDSETEEGKTKADFVKNLFEASVLVANQQQSHTIKQHAELAHQACPTLFSSSQTTIFVGESILFQSLKEKDP